MINEDRKYVAISIKHTYGRGWKFGKPCVLWGYHQTDDDELRCFTGYTYYLSKAERYALGDFTKHGYDIIKDDVSVELSENICKLYKNYDSVLVEYNQYKAYCELFRLPIDCPKENY